jgi:membrane-bound lytic murein transglycosylase B
MTRPAPAKDGSTSRSRADGGTVGSRAPRRAVTAAIALLLALLGASGARAGDPGRSWKYLTDRLVADGVDRRRVERVFGDPRFGTFRGLSFSLNPVESRSRYRAVRTPARIARARRCRARYADAFERAERTYGVPASVLAALLHVETQCGEYTGQSRILLGLARLAMANEPANLARNLNRHTHGLAGNLRRQAEDKTRERGRYLEDTFYPEVLGAFRLAERLGLDPLEIRGSGSGAFGLPQFLPTSYLRFAVDANGNGRMSLFEPDDAIASCANYLVGYGWRRGLSRSEQRSVIWGYNHSDAYVDTVLMLSDAIAAVHPSRP